MRTKSSASKKQRVKPYHAAGQAPYLNDMDVEHAHTTPGAMMGHPHRVPKKKKKSKRVL